MPDKRIEFVSYDGPYANWCRGTLVLRVDGEELVFGGATTFWEADYDDWNAIGWKIVSEYLPPELLGAEEELKTVLDENVDQSCCGGCA